RDRTKEGILCAAAALTFWGIIPIYWKLLSHLSAWELLFHRVLWGSVPLLIYLLVSGHWSGLKRLSQPRAFIASFTSAILIIANWVIFIWAVSAGHVLQLSLGHFLNPLL